jgi:hypothetical protein
MHVIAQIASERTRDNIELAEQLRASRRLRMLRRAHRTERKAERRLVAAWRRSADLESLNY